MNKREEIEKNYKVKDGRIIFPGKFEGEPIYAPYFYSLAMDGNGWISDNTCRLDILPEDRALFPEIPKRKRVIKVIEDDNGFIYIC